jgi:CHAT domain-containing protein
VFLAGCNGPSCADLYQAANQKLERRENKEALNLVEAGLKRTQNDPVCNYKFRILNARLTFSQKPKETLQFLETPVPPQLELSEFAVRRKMLQGEAEGVLGHYERARLYLEEADRLAASIAPELRGRVAIAQGNLHALQRDSRAAEADYRKGLSLAGLAQKEAGLSIQTDSLVGLGFSFLQRERFDEAVDQSIEALNLARRLNDRVEEESALGNLGYSYFQLGNLDQSIALLQEAEAAAARIDEKRHQQQWSTVQGNVYLSKRDYPNAQVHYAEALRLARGLQHPDPELTAGALHNLAQLELARGNLNKAEEYNRQAFAAEGLGSDDRSDPYLVLTTAEIAKARKEWPKSEEFLKSVLTNPKTDTSLRWQTKSDLANVFIEQQKFQEADREYQEAIQIVEKASSDVGQEDRRMSILDAWPFYDDYIRFLIDRGNFERALQIAEFSRARTLAEAFKIKERDDKTGVQVPKLKTSQIQSYLKTNNQIILAYWVAEKESYLWAITPTKFQLFRLPAKDKIERAIQFNGGYIDQRRAAEDSPAAQELYEMLVKPAEALIPKYAHVIIAPNRSLYKLNFETVVVPGSKLHYWIEDVTLQTASSIALLVNTNHRHSQTARRMLLMGAPIEASREFPVLQNAAEEVKKIASRLPAGQGKVVAGKDATPQSYRSSNPGQYKFIHFVTHGTASQMSPLDSAIILSPGVENSYKLYAREIKAIPVHAELVTISACESAGKKTYAGEGLVGLAWAFMRAGAHQVVAALWEVDDASTPQLMDDFYSELGKGKSAVDALHDAKLQMLRSGSLHRPPYYWASLQLYTGS